MGYKNPEDQKQYHKEWYKRNKKRLIKKAKKNNLLYRKRNRDYIWSLKNKGTCVDCGNKFHPVAMDFDHLGTDKTMNIARFVNQSASIKTIDREIAKCELVCSNCHRVRTFKRLWRNGRRISLKS